MLNYPSVWKKTQFMLTKKQAIIFYHKWRIAYLRDLLRQLVVRDMKLLYKRSALGIGWTLLNPLLQLCVFVFVFSLVLPVNIPNYSSFVFSGLLIWNWFQNSLVQAAGLITSNRSLLRQPNFPTSILPIVTVTTGLVHFLLALPVLLVFLVIDGVEPTSVIFLLPFLMGLQFALIVTLAYPLAALNVTFRDTQHILSVLLQMLFYLIPVFYDMNSVPEKYKIFYQINPMVIIIDSYRKVIIQGVQPDWKYLLITALIIVVILPIGHKFFQRQSVRFVEEL